MILKKCDGDKLFPTVLPDVQDTVNLETCNLKQSYTESRVLSGLPGGTLIFSIYIGWADFLGVESYNIFGGFQQK